MLCFLTVTCVIDVTPVQSARKANAFISLLNDPSVGVSPSEILARERLRFLVAYWSMLGSVHDSFNPGNRSSFRFLDDVSRYGPC
jgi:hypothetical protein